MKFQEPNFRVSGVGALGVGFQVSGVRKKTKKLVPSSRCLVPSSASCKLVLSGVEGLPPARCLLALSLPNGSKGCLLRKGSINDRLRLRLNFS